MPPMEQHAEEKDSRQSDAGVIQAYDVAIAKAYQEALDAKSELVFDLRARLAEKDAKIASLEAQLKKLESEHLPDQDSLTEITIPHIVKNPYHHPVESPE